MLPEKIGGGGLNVKNVHDVHHFGVDRILFLVQQLGCSVCRTEVCVVNGGAIEMTSQIGFIHRITIAIFWLSPSFHRHRNLLLSEKHCYFGAYNGEIFFQSDYL